MHKTTLIIPTYNRPIQLKNCMKSILAQSLKPGEVIIVDDGNLDKVPMEDECQREGIQLKYLKKDVPGLTESRNAGGRIATGDIIFFLDDDVILDKDYIAQIISVYDQDTAGRIGGVGGAITNVKPQTMQRRLRKLVEIIFLISGFKEGRVLPSGFFTDFWAPDSKGPHLKSVDFLSGGVMSFKKEIFDEFVFTDRYRAYGFGEDKDFTYQVAQKYRLVLNKRARLVHLESHEMRPVKRVYGRKFTLGRYLFFRDHIKKNPWQWILFAYALFGYFLIRIAIFYASLKRENAEHAIGIIDGVRDIINQRVLVRGQLK